MTVVSKGLNVYTTSLNLNGGVLPILQGAQSGVNKELNVTHKQLSNDLMENKSSTSAT